MSFTPFDTHAYVKHLEEAGFSEQQAEAQSKLQAQVLTEIITDSLVTKRGIEDIKANIKILEKDMDIRFKDIDIKFKDIDIKFAEVRADTKAVDTKITWLLVLIPVIGLALTISNYLHH